MAASAKDDSLVKEMWDAKIKLGHKCIKELLGMKKIDGAEKLARDIQKDVDFLVQMSPKDYLLVKSSNINRFDALVRCMKKHNGLCSVVKPYKMTGNSGILKPIIVDIVFHIDLEEIWVKVIAKNRNSLTSATLGDCAFGRRNILDQAKDFVELALQNKYNYKAPRIIFYFDSGVDGCVADALTELGIQVMGKVEYSDDERAEDWNGFAHPIDLSIGLEAISLNNEGSRATQKLNLDVGAMIGYVSELTNGGSNLVCDNEVLNQQAKAEQVRPLLPILNEIFRGRQLICCNVALDAFKTIVETLGGPNENKRSLKLIKRLTVVSNTDRPVTLKLNKRIVERSAVVFMSGEDNEAITITANNGIVQASASQGQKFAAFIHEARSLTEQKSLSMGKI